MKTFKFLNNPQLRCFYIYIGNLHYRIFTINNMDDITRFVEEHITPHINLYPNRDHSEYVLSFLSGRFHTVELVNRIDW